MKQINKLQSPIFFEQWKADFIAREGREPNYKNDFYPCTEARQALKDEIMTEQGAICCYCMQRIRKDNSHIEHFKPQSKFPNETLDYFNMFVSCNGYKDDKSHCGHKHDNVYLSVLISPLSDAADCSFKYSSSGEINGVTSDACLTIETLCLNEEHLKRKRNCAIYTALEQYEDNNEIEAVFSSLNSDGEYNPFCNAVLYYIRHSPT